MYKLGLVSVSFRKNTVEEIAAAVKGAGLSCIEWGSDVHAPKEDIAQLEKIVRIQKENGLTCCSYGTYFRLGETPMSELPGYVKAAKLLGTDIIRLWCGNKNSEDYSPEEKEALFGLCKQAAAIGEASGVTFCMECHNNTYTNRLDAALELMEAIGSAHFKMYWQPNQFRTPAENCRYAEEIAPFSEHLHVFNWSGDSKIPLGEAKELWQRYLSYFDNEKTLLLEFMPDGEISSLPTEADALREIAQEANL